MSRVFVVLVLLGTVLSLAMLSASITRRHPHTDGPRLGDNRTLRKRVVEQ